MARRPSKHLRPPRPLAASFARADVKADGRWVVRSVPADAATKSYLCPGCQQRVAPGDPHLVAWPAEPPLGPTSGLPDRRHWHTACWARRP